MVGGRGNCSTWTLIRCRVTLVLLGVAAIAAGCGGDSKGASTLPGTTLPSPAVPGTTQPSPVTPGTLVSLKGFVTQGTQGLFLGGATVTLLDGPSAGLSTVSKADGTFAFDNIPQGQVTVSAVAAGYGEEHAWVYADGRNTISFRLATPGHSAGGTFQGSISATDPRCDSPGSIHDAKPCQRYGPFEVPKSGSFGVVLQWPPGGLNELDYEVWRNGVRFTQSTEVNGPQDAVSGACSAGSYEVRVVYMGAGTQNYQLRVNFNWD
jgi:hypothetical protein